MNKCRIGIIGLGTVGEGVYKILNSELDTHPILKEIEIVKIAVKNLSKKREFILSVSKSLSSIKSLFFEMFLTAIFTISISFKIG